MSSKQNHASSDTRLRRTWAIAHVALASVLAFEAAARADRIWLVSHAASSAPTAGSGVSTPTAVSADGRYVAFLSEAADLIAGYSGTGSQVFLWDRDTGSIRLVSHASSSETTAGNAASYPAAMSADGRFVAFTSFATDLIAGGGDLNGTYDAFLWDQATGSVTLVSHASDSATSTGNGFSEPTAMSADGRYVSLASNATNLVAGGSDTNGTYDAFLWDRVTETVTLVSHASGSPSVAADAPSYPSAISADGRHVAFSSTASDLIANYSGSNTQAYVWDRDTGSTTLMSRVPGSPTEAGNSISIPRLMSADGRYVALESYSSNLIAGGSDTNGENDAFLWDRATGLVILVSHASNSTTIAGNGGSEPRAMSADGRYVAFVSHASNLITGGTDTNGTGDTFVWDMDTGSVTLVSRTPGSATTTGNSWSDPTAMSADGRYVAFYSYASNLIPGGTDTNGTFDAFLWDRDTGAVALVSHASGSATVTANAYAFPTAMSTDGRYMAFYSSATDLIAGATDTNGTYDAFHWDRDAGSVELVSGSPASATTASSGKSEAMAMSADGRYVAFESDATDLIAGYSGSGTQTYLWDRATKIVTLVSHAVGATTTAGNSSSVPRAMSADGRYVAFYSLATDLVAGYSGSGAEAYLWDRETGLVALISHVPGAATTSGNGPSEPRAISADGRYIAFQSFATDLVAGGSDINSTDDAFVWDRDTGLVTLVSHAAGSSTTTGSGASYPRAMSPDGRFVAFQSRANNLIAGGTDANGEWDAFLWDRETGLVILVSHAAGAGTIAGSGGSVPLAMSADGRFVTLNSAAANLIGGYSGSGNQVFQWDRNAGLAKLVSHAPGTPSTAGNNASYLSAGSADGRYVAFYSLATNLIAGGSDTNGTYDAYLWDRDTGSVTLVSHVAGAATTTANHYSEPRALSANGRYLAFLSPATNLIAGGSDTNGWYDAFVWDRDTGAVALVSHASGSVVVAANHRSLPAAISATGEYVAFTSRATDLLPAGSDTNSTEDTFLWTNLQAEAVPPSDPTILSTSPLTSSWSKHNMVEVTWSGAADDPIGSGLAGYSVEWNHMPVATPDAVIDVPHTADPHSVTSAALSPDGSDWYLHLRTCDLDGNCTATVHAGPFWIDTTAPSAVANLQSTSHSTGVPSPATEIELVFAEASDGLSGIDGYAVAVDGSPTWTCDGTKDLEESGLSFSEVVTAGTWYAHVCALDNAGNAGPVVTAGPYLVGPAGAAPVIYWTSYGTGAVGNASADGSVVTTLLNDTGAALGVAVDPEGGKLYWAETANGRIRRANLDGSGAVTIASYYRPRNLVLDVNEGRLYWTAEYSNQITRANLDGSGQADYLPSPGANPWGLAIDTGAGKLYWTEYSGQVRRGNRDGTGIESLTASTGTRVGLALDRPRGHLYWLEEQDGTIHRANLDGSAHAVVLTGQHGARGLAVDEVNLKLYWTAMTANQVRRANLDGSSIESVFTTPGTFPHGVALLRLDTSVPTDPAIDSTSPVANLWSNDSTVEVSWSGAEDEPGGWGLAGYSVLFDGNPTTQPDATVDVPHTDDPHATTSAALADGTWYFHLSTCDVAGNCTATVHAGPFLIDATAPSAPGAVTSASHGDGQPESDATIDVAWGAASDALSGVALYRYAWTGSATQPSCSSLTDTTAATSASSGGLADGTWYAHVCAVDGAGNEGAVATGGPYVVDTAGPTGLVVSSPSHTASTWSNDATVDFTYSGAVDPNGVAGYSVIFDQLPGTEPDTAVDQAGASFTGTASPDGNDWYVHVRACDTAGNCGATVHSGPYWIDATAPSVPGAVTSASHGDGEPKLDPTIDIVWDAATDALSGVALYRYGFTGSPAQPSCSALVDTTSATSATSEPLADGTWYGHICAVDEAGNEGTVATGGPYRVGLAPPAQRAVLRVDYADWIEAPPVANLDLPSELTIELWVYLEEAALPNEPLLRAELPGGQLGFGLFWDGSGRRVWFAETERLSGEVSGCCQSPQLELGQWAHVAFTLAPDLTPRIYVDGVEGLGGGLSGFPVDTSSAVVRLASFRGAARQVRIWSRALDLAELRVRATSPAAGGEPGLVVAWPLDDGVGSEARNVVAPASPFTFPRDYFRGQPAWARAAVVDQPYFRSHSSPAPVAYHTGAVLDLDLDGDRDLIAHMPDPSIWATHPPVAYRNVGGVGFTEDTAALLGGPIPGLFGLSRPWTVIDLTGDGLEDVLVPDYGPDDYPFPGEQARLFVRQVDGRLVDETATRLPALTVLQHGWAVGDVDGDGAPDIVLVAFGDGGDPRLTSRLLLNDGSGHFSERTDWFPGPWPGVYLGGELLDADGDGDLDLFLGSTGGNVATREHDTLLLNDGTGQFSLAPAGALPPRYLGVGWVTYDAKSADLDGDGHSDLVAVLNETPPEGGTVGQHLQLLLANGDGTFRDGSDGLPQDALAPMNGDLWVRDVNGDGLPDIVTYWASPYRRLLYLNVGGARFVDASEALPAVHAGLMPADLDGDGNVDFAGFGFHRAEIVAQEALRPLDLSTWGDFSLGVEPSHLEVETGSSATTRTVTVRAAFTGSLALESESPDPRLEVSFGAAGISAEEAVEVTVEAAPDLPAGRYAVVVRARSEEAVRQAVLAVRVTHDAPPANPTAVNSSPLPSTWWSGSTVDVSWSGAEDDPGGSGLAGYSILWDQADDTLPDASIEVPHTADPHVLTSPSLVPDGDGWHFHLRTCDLAGNCSEPLHFGPFWIDTTAPGAPGAVTSASHGDGLPKSDSTIEVAWSASTDNLSGVALYRYGFTGSSTQPSCSALSHTTSSLSAVSDPQPDGTWYAHVCAEDEAGNEGAVTTGGPYAIDTVPPRVTSVSTVRDTGDGTLGQGEVTGASITQLYLTFDKAMAGPVTTPGSYRVTSAGPDLVLETAGCGPLVGDDEAVAIGAVAYDAGAHRAAVRLAASTALPVGLYGGAGCAALTDAAGNALDGDGDGTGGDDFVRLFGVEVTNLLANPNFDEDVAGWSGPALWGAADADGKPTSGSTRVESAAGTGATLELVQCVAAVPDASYRAGATARVESAFPGAPAVSLRLDFHAAPACGGAPSTAVPRLLAAGTTSGAWAPGELRGVPVPAGSASVGLRLVVEEGAAVAYAVDLDLPLLAEDFDLLDDGFESGALDAWGGVAP